jgi:PAS domain S-box-containing protein
MSVFRWGPNASELFQWESEEARGKDALELIASISEDESLPERLQECLKKGDEFEETITLKRKDGSRFDGLLRASRFAVQGQDHITFLDLMAEIPGSASG